MSTLTTPPGGTVEGIEDRAAYYAEQEAKARLPEFHPTYRAGETHDAIFTALLDDYCGELPNGIVPGWTKETARAHYQARWASAAALPPNGIGVTLNPTAAKAALAGMRTAYLVSAGNAREAQERGETPNHAAMIELARGITAVQRALKERGA